jgi:FMN phosphatase YigB (HAD superfamily)
MKLDPSRVTTIVFDVDGTLYHQGGVRRAMLFRLLGATLANPFVGISTFRALQAYRQAQESLREGEACADLAAEQLRIACQGCGQTERKMTEIVERWMNREPLDLLRRFVDPALRPLLDAARSRGLRLGVFSDYPAATKLEAMDLSHFFDVVLSAQDAAVNRFKPHPTGLIETLQRLGAAPEQALYVGDRFDVDAAVARAAGVPCVIVGRRQKATADDWVHVSSHSELHTILFPPATELSS